MMTTTLAVAMQITIPTTADEWELYTTSMDCTEAAEALTQAVVNALTDPYEMTVYQRFKKHVDPVMFKYRNVGASDTEPRCRARQVFRQAYGDDAVEAAF
jgi:hypothetical protein